MRKLLWIKDSEEFWKVFGRERIEMREKLRRLPFAKKIEIISQMQKMSLLKRVSPRHTKRG